MKQILAKILLLGAGILLTASLFSWPTPAHAGLLYWSAETIPARVDNVLGPPGIDVRDFAIADDATTIYAVSGNSTSDNVVYKSANAGVSWSTLIVSISADLVAVAPDDKNIVVIARSSPVPVIYVTFNGGTTWDTLGTPQETDPAAAIYDITISETRAGKHYIAAAGKDSAANLWYYTLGTPAATWQETKILTGFNSGSEMAAVAFSPAFVSDATLVAISDNTSPTANVKLQILDLSAARWNSDAGYLSYPCAISNSGITGLVSASLSLSPTYDATDYDTRRLFIGLTFDSNSSDSGIYRFVDTIETEMLLNINIHSIAYNGSYLVAGAYDTNTVYRCTSPLASSPTFSTSTDTKNPGGERKVKVAWMGSSVVAGTSGNESAFAISGDIGTTFNDISLIDTAITHAEDVAVSADADKIFLVTDDGADLSLWRKASAWQRVFSLRDSIDYIVRIEPQNANVIYLAKQGAETIYYNSSAGSAQWATRLCNIDIRDIAVESTTVAYVLNDTGSVSKTNNNGLGWSNEVPTTLGTGATIVSVSPDTLLVGSQNGYVAYSTNGSTSWTLISQVIDNLAGNVQVVADESFASNHIIYAASDKPGRNLMKWQIGTSSTWTDIFNGTFDGGIYGLAVDSDTLYALEYNDVTHQSTIWRHFSPTTATATSTDWSFSPTTTTTDIDDQHVHLNATPQALKTSSGELWAVKTNDTNKLYSFTDIGTEMEITLNIPASGFVDPVNNISGFADDVLFNWERPSVATEYELLISQDNDFISQVARITVASEDQVVSVMAGSHQAGNKRVDFMPGVTYYWKIRTSKPMFSPYSEAKYFVVQPVVASVPQLLVPANGGMNVGKKPSFSWNPVASATEYQFMLSTNITMTSPIIDIKVDKAGYNLSEELDYGKTYFWKIRATTPTVSDWSTLANFTVEKKPAEPVPPVVVQQVPAPVINLPAPSTPPAINLGGPPPEPPPPFVPDYLIGAAIIMGVLLLLVVFLIIRPLPARLFPAVSLPGPLVGPARRVKGIGTRLRKPRTDLKTGAEASQPSRPSKEKAIRPIATEKAGERETVAFAVKSFIWMTNGKNLTGEGQPGLSEKEEQALGKKLAYRIQALAKKEPLHLKYPEEAAAFLEIWARYGSRDETNRYLSRSCRSRPANAIALLKCFLPVSDQPDTGAGTREFTRSQYNSLAKVVDPDIVYAALTKLFKFKPDSIEDKVPINPSDRAIAYKFLRIHLQEKDKPKKPTKDKK
jgi:hypothetical protein